MDVGDTLPSVGKTHDVGEAHDVGETAHQVGEHDVGDTLLSIDEAHDVSEDRNVGETAHNVGEHEVGDSGLGALHGQVVGLPKSRAGNRQGRHLKIRISEIDLADEVILRIRDVENARTVQGEADREAECRVRPDRGVEIARAPRRAGEGAHLAIGEFDEADEMVAGIADDQARDAADIREHETLRRVQMGQVGRTIVAAAFARDAGEGRGNTRVRVVLENGVVGAIRDVNDVFGIHRHTVRLVQTVGEHGVHRQLRAGAQGHQTQHGQRPEAPPGSRPVAAPAVTPRRDAPRLRGATTRPERGLRFHSCVLFPLPIQKDLPKSGRGSFLKRRETTDGHPGTQLSPERGFQRPGISRPGCNSSGAEFIWVHLWFQLLSQVHGSTRRR